MTAGGYNMNKKINPYYRKALTTIYIKGWNVPASQNYFIRLNNTLILKASGFKNSNKIKEVKRL